jgi:hypothetical protein
MSKFIKKEARMKKLFGVVTFSIILSLLNQGYSQENPILIDSSSVSKLIMQNSWIRVTLSTTTGEILSFIDWRSGSSHELLTDNAYIMFIRKRNNDTIYQSEGTVVDTLMGDTANMVWAVFDIKFPFFSAETTYLVQIKYILDVQALRWDAKLQRHVNPDTAWEANINFSFPAIANMDCAFWTKDGAPFELPMTRTVTYRGRPVVLPALILYNDNTDIGLSFVGPFELRKPKLEWEMKDSSFIIANRYLRLSRNHPCSTAVYIVPHEGDWRPGLAWIYNKYDSFFTPVSQNVIDGEGWYRAVNPEVDTSQMNYLKGYGVTWVEYHGHFPFYGLYAPCAPSAPNKDTWNIIIDIDSVPFDTWKIKILPGIDTVSYDSNKAQIKRWDSLGIQPYIYFESFESWIQYANEVFPLEFATAANDSPLPAWKYCYLMNPDPNGLWGMHIISQIDTLLANYPNVAGIFYDRDDYCDYDYNPRRNDGVTMIGPDSAYMLAFAQEKLNDTLLKIVHNHDSGTADKGVWTNQPSCAEVCKNMDGIMSEDIQQAPFQQYLGISRPLILLPKDITEQQAEEKSKTALWTGHFPSVTSFPGDHPESETMDYRYKPLFSLYKGTKWVLYPHAL